MTQGSVHLCRGRIIEWIIAAEWTANGCKWSGEPSPLVNCAKIGLGYFVRSVNGLALHGVCMINFSLFSKASWFPVKKKKKRRANQNPAWRRRRVRLATWLVGAQWTGGRGRALPFYSRVCPARKGHQAGLRRILWTVWSWSTPLYGPLGGAWPHLSCQMMNPVQGSPSEDGKQLHQKEDTETEEEEAQPKDMTTEKGYKHQRSSLPFSVESLISKKTTCRSAFPPSEFTPVPPKPVAAQSGAQFSPRTLYAERKLSTESSPGVSSCSSEESPQFCDKDQSPWFQTASFPTPPRKCVPLLNEESFTTVTHLPSRW